MIVIDDVIISDDVLEEKFVCDLNACKGACCEEGDAGAPLTKDELAIVKNAYEIVKPYLPKASIKKIEADGFYEYSTEFGWVTPTLPSDNEICVYARREVNGLITCAFEKAYNDGLIPWKKPISCHLYPILAKEGKHGDYTRVNYSPREVTCSPACVLGEKLKVAAYLFLKEPIIRRWGPAFYEALETIAQKNNVLPGDTGNE